MKLVTFDLCGRDRVGAVLEGRLIDLNAALTAALVEVALSSHFALASPRRHFPGLLRFLVVT
jgi:hypothetical protein